MSVCSVVALSALGLIRLVQQKCASQILRSFAGLAILLAISTAFVLPGAAQVSATLSRTVTDQSEAAVVCEQQVQDLPLTSISTTSRQVQFGLKLLW